MAKVGRPQTLTPEQIQKVVEDFEDYIAKKDDPTIVGFTAYYPPIILDDGSKFYLNKNYISDHDEFSELRKAAIEKQEAYLLDGATHERTHPTFSMFRLKQPQHGYTDRQDHDHTSKGDKIEGIAFLPVKRDKAE